METIEKSGFILEIMEYGKIVRQYHDINQKRFKKESERIILDHLSYNDIKNTIFKIYEY